MSQKKGHTQQEADLEQQLKTLLPGVAKSNSKVSDTYYYILRTKGHKVLR